MKTKPEKTTKTVVAGDASQSASKSGTHSSPTKTGSVDFTKEWSNGHKCFGSAESRSFVENLITEEKSRERYNQIKADLRRPRDPLVGGPTPRDSRGIVIMNPRLLNTVTNGNALFTRDQLDGTAPTTINMSRFGIKEPVGKIGVVDTNYHILGNTDGVPNPAQLESYFQTVNSDHLKKQQQLEEQAKLNEFIAKEKAKRHKKQLARQVLLLQREMQHKVDELNFLKENYHV